MLLQGLQILILSLAIKTCCAAGPSYDMCSNVDARNKAAFDLTASASSGSPTFGAAALSGPCSCLIVTDSYLTVYLRVIVPTLRCSVIWIEDPANPTQRFRITGYTLYTAIISMHRLRLSLSPNCSYTLSFSVGSSNSRLGHRFTRITCNQTAVRQSSPPIPPSTPPSLSPPPSPLPPFTGSHQTTLNVMDDVSSFDFSNDFFDGFNISDYLELSDDTSNEAPDTGTIVGIAVGIGGAVIVIIIVSIVAAICWRRMKSRQLQQSSQDVISSDPTANSSYEAPLVKDETIKHNYQPINFSSQQETQSENYNDAANYDNFNGRDNPVQEYESSAIEGGFKGLAASSAKLETTVIDNDLYAKQ